MGRTRDGAGAGLKAEPAKYSLRDMGEPHAIDLGNEVAVAAASAAAWRGVSLEDYVREVVATAARMDAELAAFVQEGVDSADRGELVSQEEMEAWAEARYRTLAAE